ncbi:MAG: T9SS type A sorting domain-containing protein [Chitinophagales bacterium]|nr:T9SS type A sorting domain-containing protein [Chitinophagales bacterium]
MKTCVLFLFLNIIGNFVFSQIPPAITWQHPLGGTNNDIAYSVIQSADGGFVVAGNSASNDGDILRPADNLHGGNYDEWIVKLDAQSNILWKRHTGGVGSDVAIKVMQMRDGGYIVGGNSSSFDTIGSYSNSDYWLNKLNSDGTIAWSKNYGGSGYDDFGSLDTTSDGGLILCGGSSSFDRDVTGNYGASDFWLVKTDGLGNIQWQKNYGGSEYDKAQSVKQTADGGYVVTGFTSSNNIDVTGFHGVTDGWLVKLNAVGNIFWEQCYGGSLDDYAYDILVLPDNNYIFCGYTFSSDGDVVGNHGLFDAWVMKIDQAGKILWQRCYGGDSIDYVLAMDKVSDNGFILGGFSTSTNGDCTSNYGGQDFWILRIDSLGSLMWQKNYGGTVDDVCNSVYTLKDGNYITAGYTTSNDGDVIGNHTPYSYKDYWVVLLDGTVGISFPDSANKYVNGFPMPAQNYFTLDLNRSPLPANKKVEVQIVDLLGKDMIKDMISDKMVTVDCSSWQAGIYLYRLKTENDIIAKGKILIQK